MRAHDETQPQRGILTGALACLRRGVQPLETAVLNQMPAEALRHANPVRLFARQEEETHAAVAADPVGLEKRFENPFAQWKLRQPAVDQPQTRTAEGHGVDADAGLDRALPRSDRCHAHHGAVFMGDAVDGQRRALLGRSGKGIAVGAVGDRAIGLAITDLPADVGQRAGPVRQNVVGRRFLGVGHGSQVGQQLDADEQIFLRLDQFGLGDGDLEVVRPEAVAQRQPDAQLLHLVVDGSPLLGALDLQARYLGDAVLAAHLRALAACEKGEEDGAELSVQALRHGVPRRQGRRTEPHERRTQIADGQLGAARVHKQLEVLAAGNEVVTFRHRVCQHLCAGERRRILGRDRRSPCQQQPENQENSNR